MDKEDKIKVGDTVDYTGKLSGGNPRKNCIVNHIEGPNSMFRCKMATLEEVVNWVAVSELVKTS